MVKSFQFSILSRQTLGPNQSPIQWVTEAFSPGVKRQGREADHSPQTSAEVKKTWIYIKYIKIYNNFRHLCNLQTFIY
jgi:hypothetical protein